MIKDYRKGKSVVEERTVKGKILNLCASFDSRYICCRTHVLGVISNCPFNCSYCFLQKYLTDTTTYYVESKLALSEVEETISSNENRVYRIGTWELGDSLATPRTDKLNMLFIEAFSAFKNALLELKTKSNRVSALMNLMHRERTVISWSMNTEKIIKEEEKHTASLADRVFAMKKVIDKGYPIALHFDPIIFYENFLEDYIKLIRYIFNVIPSDRVAWISLGSLRFHPEMRREIAINYPYTKLLREEMVRGDDNKLRYPRPKRSFIYRTICSEIQTVTKGDCFIYLCMERPNVWQEVFKSFPQSISELDFLFSLSLYKRLGLFFEPKLEHYYVTTK